VIRPWGDVKNLNGKKKQGKSLEKKIQLLNDEKS